MNAEQAGSLPYPLRPAEKAEGLSRFAFWRSGNNKDSSDETGQRAAEPNKDLLVPEPHIIADVLPHNLKENPMTYADIFEIMRWAKHPEVANRVYQLEGGDENLYRSDRRRSMYIDYYQGWRDDEGRPTKPENSIFPKAINATGEMIASCRLTRDAYYLNPDAGNAMVRSDNAMALERLIVRPEDLGKKIGLGFTLTTMDIGLYMYDGFDGMPADRLNLSIYIDVDSARNWGLFKLVGFMPDGGPRDVNGRVIQPFITLLPWYEQARPRAIDHLGHAQPKWAEYLERIEPELKENLEERKAATKNGH